MSTFFHRSSVAVAVALLAGAACTVHQSETPALTGPSSFGGTVVTPVEAPTPVFTETPTPVNFNIPVTFDASTSCGGKMSLGVCSNSSVITKYAWDFGDGSTGAGKTTAHTFRSSTQPATTFNVTLTLTNDQSISASVTKALVVGASPAPSASFVASPTAPVVGQTAFFDANASRAAAGHSIVEWDWDFGDGVIASGSSLPLTTHTYSIPATYVIVLKVVDEVGLVGTASVPLTVGNGNPTAVLSLNDVGGGSNRVQADATASTAAGGATITNYLFVWDNNGDASDSGPLGTITHQFVSQPLGSHTVRLTVTDSLGRTATTQQSITTK
jgi:PKD repeat protein